MNLARWQWRRQLFLRRKRIEPLQSLPEAAGLLRAGITVHGCKAEIRGYAALTQLFGRAPGRRLFAAGNSDRAIAAAGPPSAGRYCARRTAAAPRRGRAPPPAAESRNGTAAKPPAQTRRAARTRSTLASARRAARPAGRTPRFARCASIGIRIKLDLGLAAARGAVRHIDHAGGAADAEVAVGVVIFMSPVLATALATKATVPRATLNKAALPVAPS